MTHSAPVSEGPSPIHSLDSSESTSISLSLQQQRPQLQQPSSHSGSDEGGTGEVNTTTNQNSGQVSLQQTGQQPQAAHSGTTPTQSSAAEVRQNLNDKEGEAALAAKTATTAFTSYDPAWNVPWKTSTVRKSVTKKLSCRIPIYMIVFSRTRKNYFEGQFASICWKQVVT